MLVDEKGMESLLIWEKELSYQLLEGDLAETNPESVTNKWLPSP